MGDVLKMWQLNLQHGKSSTAVLAKNLPRVDNAVVLIQGPWVKHDSIFSGRELAFTFAICYRPSVCLSVVCRLSSVTLVRPTQPVEIFRNFFHHTIAQGL